MARFERDGEVFEITSEAADYLSQLRERLHAGWARVRDPRVEVSVEGEPREPVLEAALRADPCDAGTALVYADWLQQRGHPRGALIALQHLLATRGDAGLLAEERRVILDAGNALLSRSLQRTIEVHSAHPAHPSIDLPRSLYGCGALVWDHGFLRTAAVPIAAHAADEDLLWELLRHPSARMLTSLDVPVVPPRDLGLVVALLVHGARPPLRRLRLVAAAGRTYVVLDALGLAAAYPELEELELAANRVTLGALPPNLRRLVVRSRSERDDALELLAAAAHPALVELDVMNAYAPDLARILERDRAPNLRVLRLPRVPQHGVPHVRALVDAALARSLEVLDLGTGHLAQRVIHELVAARGRFASLASLRVREEYVAGLRDAGYPAEPGSGD